MSERIAILCSDEPHHDYLIGLLSSRFPIVAIVREPGSEQRERARREGRWKDYIYALYHNARRSLLGLNRYRRRYFADAIAPTRDCETARLDVRWINVPEVAELLSRVQPDLTIVMGTSILKRDVLQHAGRSVINIHGGYLPAYRGNHCIFFALYAGDFDRIGSTIHFVDAGIDTGNVIEHVTPRIEARDNAEALYCRAEKLAIHRLADLIATVRGGATFRATPQVEPGHLYRTRDRHPWHDLHHWMRCLAGTHRRALNVWRARLPQSDGTELASRPLPAAR